MSIADSNQKNNRPAKWIAFDRVVRDPSITPGAKAVFALLFTYTNESGECWPGVERLTQELGKSKRWVMYHLCELSRAGAIERMRRGKRLTNVYKLCGDVQNTALHPESDVQTIALHKSDVQNTSPVMCKYRYSDVQNSVSQNTPPAYSYAASGERNSPEEQVSITDPDLLTTSSGEEAEFISVLKTVKEYPLDPEKDILLYQNLKELFPGADIQARE